MRFLSISLAKGTALNLCLQDKQPPDTTLSCLCLVEALGQGSSLGLPVPHASQGLSAALWPRMHRRQAALQDKDSLC